MGKQLGNDSKAVEKRLESNREAVGSGGKTVEKEGKGCRVEGAEETP